MADGLTEGTETVPTRERPLELYGKVAIVTGAAKGMGGPICTALAEEGAAIVLAGPRHGRDREPRRPALTKASRSSRR